MPGKHNWRDPKRLYNAQKSKALTRGISWELTFEQWWKIWQDSGRWSKRGKRMGQFVMSRKGDMGPYSVDNVVIKECGENNREGMKGWHDKKQLETPNEKKGGRVTNENFEKLEPKFERPQRIIPVEEFKAKKEMIKKVWKEDNSPTKQQNHWTIEKIICLVFPVWGPRWFAPNK